MNFLIILLAAAVVAAPTIVLADDAKTIAIRRANAEIARLEASDPDHTINPESTWTLAGEILTLIDEVGPPPTLHERLLATKVALEADPSEAHSSGMEALRQVAQAEQAERTADVLATAAEIEALVAQKRAEEVAARLETAKARLTALAEAE